MDFEPQSCCLAGQRCIEMLGFETQAGGEG